MTTRTTMKGPGGWRLVLDPSEVFPSDPGRGTPAMVESPDGGCASTYWAAMDTGEALACAYPWVDCEIPGVVIRWLDSAPVVAAIDRLGC